MRVGCVGTVVTVIVTPELVTGPPSEHAELELNVTVTTSPSTKVEDV